MNFREWSTLVEGKVDNACVDCHSGMTYLDRLDRLLTVEGDPICRVCMNKRGVRASLMDDDMPHPQLHVGSLGKGRTPQESVDALKMEQSVLVLELFSEGL